MDEPVQAPEKRSQCLAGPGRGKEQRVLARRDRVPAKLLRVAWARQTRPGTNRGRPG